MATRAEIMRRLSALPTEELLHLLRDETIFEIASKYFESMEMDSDQMSLLSASSVSTSTESRTNLSEDRAKRPLNAFMAFRSYYLKLFPDIQQKTASGFLTSLWNKDPYRNKWALIAKVYSFVRDEIGKSKVSLSYFLSLSCPVMNIIEPASYLEYLGWEVEEDETGCQNLHRPDAAAAMKLVNFDSEDCPNTEVELLARLINIGYLPDQGYDLVNRINCNNSGIITTTGGKGCLPVPYTKQKIAFMNAVRSDPIQAAKELLGDSYDACTIQLLGVNSHNVEDLNSINHLSMQVARPDPRQYYNYSVSHSHIGFEEAPVFGIDHIPDYESFDIDSPWDLDVILGQSLSEGERTADLPGSPGHDSREDFHYMF